MLGRTVRPLGERKPSWVNWPAISSSVFPSRASRRIVSSISRLPESRAKAPTVTARSASDTSPPFQTTRQWTVSGTLRSTTTLSIRHRNRAFFCSCEKRLASHHSGIVRPASLAPGVSRCRVEPRSLAAALLVPAPLRPA